MTKKNHDSKKKYTLSDVLIACAICSFFAYAFGNSTGRSDGKEAGARLESCMNEETRKGSSREAAFDFCSPPVDIDPS